MLKQKYKKGDYVHVVKDLGNSMSHFKSDCDAIVMGSYNDQFGDGEDYDEDDCEEHEYTIHIKGSGESSWYYESQLELIESNRLDLVKQWKAEEKTEEEMKGDLDWIFSHGKELKKEAHGATVVALAKCFGLTNLWGSRGEGITWYTNATMTLQLAKSFILEGDKEGWLKFCERIKKGK